VQSPGATQQAAAKAEDPRRLTYLPIGMKSGEFLKSKRGTTFMKSMRRVSNEKMAATEALPPPQMMSNLIDLTHDTLPEIEWRPIKKY